MFIYPEGTRRLPGAPPRYKQGAAALYAETGVPACRSPSIPDCSGGDAASCAARRRGDRISASHRAGAYRATFGKRLQSTIEMACDRLNAEAIAKDPSLAAVVAEGANSEPKRCVRLDDNLALFY